MEAGPRGLRGQFGPGGWRSSVVGAKDRRRLGAIVGRRPFSWLHLRRGLRGTRRSRKEGLGAEGSLFGTRTGRVIGCDRCPLRTARVAVLIPLCKEWDRKGKRKTENGEEIT